MCGLRAICEGASDQWTDLRFHLRETAHDVWFCSRSSVPATLAETGQVVQMRVLQTVALLQRFLGYRWQPSEIHLESRNRPAALFFDMLGGPRIFTARPFTAVPVPKSLLARPGPWHSQASGLSDGKADESDITRWDWLQRLRAILPGYVVGSGLNVEAVAGLLDVNVRTLQRMLLAEGLTFRELAEQARCEVARELLADTSISISSVGQQLGYSEPTNFTRAFRRMTGRTPTQFRAELS